MHVGNSKRRVARSHTDTQTHHTHRSTAPSDGTMSGHIDEVRTESYVGAVSPADKKASSARAGAQNTGGPNHLDLGTSPFVIPTKQPLA